MATWMRTSNYTKGRDGYKVLAIVPHISCCSTIGAIDNTFGPYSSRKVSTHYAVSEDATHQYVSESDTAWSVGNWPWNCRTISIEHVGTTANPPTRKCLDRGAALMADIAYRMGWKTLVLGDNVRLHKEFAATACPANMEYEWEISRANTYLQARWNKDEAAKYKKKAQGQVETAKLKSIMRRNNGMEMIFYIKGERGTRYLSGSFQRILGSPEELTAVEDAYRMAYGMEIPHVVLNADKGKALLKALDTK